jgi:hypothetical protein
MTPEPPPRPKTLLGDLKEVQRYAALIQLFASIPAIGLPGLVAKLLHIDEVIGLWQLVAATAPLTAAVTVIGLALLSKHVEPGYMLWIAPFSLLGSLFLGLMLGQDLPVGDFKGSNPMEFTFAILAAYYRHYGAWSFATSILVGCLLAWAWSRKLWPRIVAAVRRPACPGAADSATVAGGIRP